MSPWTLDKGENGCLVYVDTTSIAIRDGYKKMWVMSSCEKAKSPENTSALPFSSQGRLYYFNCAEQTMMLVQMVRYADAYARGAITDTSQYEVKPEAFAAAAPDSTDADLLRMACNRN